MALPGAAPARRSASLARGPCRGASCDTAGMTEHQSALGEQLAQARQRLGQRRARVSVLGAKPYIGRALAHAEANFQRTQVFGA